MEGKKANETDCCPSWLLEFRLYHLTENKGVSCESLTGSCPINTFFEALCNTLVFFITLVSQIFNNYLALHTIMETNNDEVIWE